MIIAHLPVQGVETESEGVGVSVRAWGDAVGGRGREGVKVGVLGELRWASWVS